MGEDNQLISLVAGNIRSLRLKLGMSQKVLAEKAGFDVRYVQKVERDPQNLTLKVLEKFAAVLQVSPGELLDTSSKGKSSKAVKAANTLKTPSDAIRYAVEILKAYEKTLD